MLKIKNVGVGSPVNIPEAVLTIAVPKRTGVLNPINGKVAVGGAGVAVAVACGVGVKTPAVSVNCAATVCAAEVKITAGSIGVLIGP